jgi:sigma-B regulation protein RsbU (phosphoserine phosphatase)
LDSQLFHPKAFYRKFDSLLTEIGRAAKAREILPLVLKELVTSFGEELCIRSGSIYMRRPGYFKLIEGPIGASDRDWPPKVPIDDHAVIALMQHKIYIFNETIVPSWGRESVALMVGEGDRYLLAFRIRPGWVRETLEFSLNTIRSTLNFSRSTSQLQADMQEASRIQRSLLPEHDPVFEGYDIAGRSVAAELVGGDLYDYQALDEQLLGIAIGDASGHGLPAALLARDVVTGLRMGVENEMKISGVIKKLNSVINKSRLSTRFVSLVFGELEQNGTFVYVNAGHPPPILFKESGEFELSTGGTILGPIAESVFQRGFAFIFPGDILLLYTDGIIERSDPQGNHLGKEGVKEFMRSVYDKSAREIVNELFAMLRSFGSVDDFQDDATVIVVKRNF